MEPLVSVLVPIYNGAEFLRATLDCLVRQTDSRFQILCLDDGSKDHSADIIRSYRDPRIFLIQQENRGLCETLNRGIAQAKTPFIARNDQDDLSEPNRLQRQIAFMEENSEVDCIFTHYGKIGRRRAWNNSDKQASVPGQSCVFRGIPDGCQLASTMFAKTEVLRAIGGFRQAYYPADDWDIQLRLAERFKVRILLEALVQYRFHFGANTYRLFATMQMKARWAEDSHHRRSQGLHEQTFEEFQRGDQGTRWFRARRGLKEFAALQLRMAGQHFLDGRPLHAAARGFLSFAFNPGEILNRLRRMRVGGEG
jgi:glycosyltransferase involved in cell wall biosynthesis